MSGPQNQCGLEAALEYICYIYYTLKVIVRITDESNVRIYIYIYIYIYISYIYISVYVCVYIGRRVVNFDKDGGIRS